MRKSFRRHSAVFLLGACLAACGGGSSSDPPASANPPDPVPVPQPPPPPAPVTTVPPQSPTPINLDDNHQVGTNQWADGNTSTGGQGANVAGLDCLPTMDETYHVHTHVSIFLNGEALAVPANIGIVRTVTPNCFYSVHTHDKSGKIHVEAPAPGMFTLGQLFGIWGQPLTNTNLAGFVGLPIVVYVTDNGVVTEARDNWPDIELRSHREVTIQIGTPITEIPNYTWSAN